MPADNRSAGSLATGVVSGFGFVLSLSTKPTNQQTPNRSPAAVSIGIKSRHSANSRLKALKALPPIRAMC